MWHWHFLPRQRGGTHPQGLDLGDGSEGPKHPEAADDCVVAQASELEEPNADHEKVEPIPS